MNDTADARAAQLRIKFLHDAADLLFTRSLSVSAHLSRIEADGSHVAGATDRYCTGCRVRLLPGWSCEQVRGPQDSSSGKKHIVTQRTGDTLYACKLCHQHLRIKKSTRMKASTATTKATSQAAAISTIPIDAMDSSNDRPSKPPAVAVSATTSQTPAGRRKARSKHATLQALLGKQKEQTTSQEGFGLGFQDLLKK